MALHSIEDQKAARTSPLEHEVQDHEVQDREAETCVFPAGL